MSLPTEAELKRCLRVIKAWANVEISDMADVAEIKPDTLRNYFTAKRSGPPVDVALRLADHYGVPRDFVLHGWGTVDHDAATERRLAAIERHIGLTAAD